MPSKVLESHVTLAQLANVEEVTVVAVVEIGLALLEEDAVAVEKVTSKIGHKLRVSLVVAVEVTEAALNAEAVAVLEPDLATTVPNRQ